MRKLASIQRILSVTPVANADALDTVMVLGWQSVVKKGEYKVGDLCIFLEVDSILPAIEEFSFLEKFNYRLKTARLRGQLSQGLCAQLSLLPEDTVIEEGLDVTEILGVTKYEEPFPAEMIGKSKGFHPKTVRKTGEVRVQSDPRLLAEFQGLDVAVTTKIEGVSTSYIYHEGELDVCSHTHSLLEDEDCLQWQMLHKYNILGTLKNYKGISIQGEIAGPGIFGNPMGLQAIEFFVFRVTNTHTGVRRTPTEMKIFCDIACLNCVPFDVIENFNLELPEVIELAKGNYSPSGTPQEGVVILPMKPTYSEVLCDWLSMKVINNDYLLGEWKQKSKKKVK